MRAGLINELLAASADRYPEHVAIESGERKMTYSEVEEEANRLANFLRAGKAGRGSVVAFLVQDPVRAIITIIGVLKAGAAFAPLDPALPTKRLAAMLQEITPQWLIVEAGLAEKLTHEDVRPSATGNLLCLGEGPADRQADRLNWVSGFEEFSDTTRPAAIGHPDDLCYVYFTSGSTGRPKGIAGRLKGIDHFIRWEINTLKLSEKMRASLLLPLSFDASLRDALAPLCSGGTVCAPASRDQVLNARELIAWMNRQSIEVAQFIPSLLRSVLNEALTPDDFPALKYLLSCGEPLLPSDVGRWVAVFADRVQIVNLYGPTETTMAKFFYFVKPSDKDRPAIPIGKPMAGARAVVVGKDGAACPPKVIGEIYIRTPYRSHGYYKRPDLTQQVFVQNPFSDDPNDLVYKSGDLARVLDDDNYEFMGRKDDQVKVRGVRVELAEIEGLLRMHEAVRDVAVTAREDRVGEKYLCAYVVQQKKVERRDLREHLIQYVPEYMAPSQIVFMDELPRTLSGKIDRRALPTPEQMRSKESAGAAAPRGPVEEMIGEIWKRVLGISELSRKDNFFEIGGHSLLATRVLSRIRDALDVELPLRMIFEAPTVAGLASAVERGRVSARRVSAPPIRPVGRDVELPLSYAQQRLWLIQQLALDSPAYNMPLAVRLRGELDLTLLQQSLQDILARHETLRTRFVVPELHPIQIIAAPCAITIPVHSVADEPEAEREQRARNFARREAMKPFDLEHGPVWRAAIIKLGDADHVFFLCIHHVASDGWSMELLVKEFVELYEARRQGHPPVLPDLPVQYADFAVWQREWLQGEVLEEEIEYWRRQLAGLPQTDLPTDYSRKPRANSPSARQPFQLSKELTEKLKALSYGEGAMLFMTLLSALQIILGHYMGQEDVVIGTNVANRNRSEIEGLIGFFVNQLVLRANLSGNPTFKQLLRQVRETTLEAYQHQDLPFDLLVQRLQPDRSLSRTPIFQVLFVWENQQAQAANPTPLAIEAFPVDLSASRFDWLIMMREEAEGISGALLYNLDLFKPATAERICLRLRALLEAIGSAPDSRLRELERMMDKRGKPAAPRRPPTRLQKAKSKAIDIESEELISQSHLFADQSLPLVLTPTIADFDALEWVKAHTEFIERSLLQYGAILFRGFRVEGPSEFEGFASAICPNLFGDYGDLPREPVAGVVYGSTPYPNDQTILFHNESSHMHCWPLKIWFYCSTPPAHGGETPIVDCRELYRHLHPALRRKLSDKGLMYVRNFGDGVDVGWQDFFKSTSRSAVEEFCRGAGISFEWREGNRLRISRVCPAVATHPKTGQAVLFNQIQAHHISCVDQAIRADLVNLFGVQGLPRNVCYGDGEPLADAEVDEMRRLYEAHAKSFPWQQGDILMLDNMLVAHARRPFSGPRQVLVTMGEMVFAPVSCGLV